jgi:hypothetical protein
MRKVGEAASRRQQPSPLQSQLRFPVKSHQGVDVGSSAWSLDHVERMGKQMSERTIEVALGDQVSVCLLSRAADGQDGPANVALPATTIDLEQGIGVG